MGKDVVHYCDVLCINLFSVKGSQFYSIYRSVIVGDLESKLAASCHISGYLSCRLFNMCMPTLLPTPKILKASIFSAHLNGDKDQIITVYFSIPHQKGLKWSPMMSV